jgi:ABC-type nitrate/sulfonate/bicarbonate transport system permease component
MFYLWHTLLIGGMLAIAFGLGYRWAERKKMFGSIRIIFAVLITSLAGAATYVMKLRSDNAILQANQSNWNRAWNHRNR